MSILSKITDLIGGGLVSSVMDTVKAYLPPGMTPQQEAELRLELDKLAFEKQKQADAVISEAEKAVTERISLLEGTATDLRALPVVGPVMLFLRGAQRPVWGFATMWADGMWFSGQWGVLSQQQESALWLINMLVLSFLFGERAVSNLAPIVSEMLSKRQAK